MFKDEYCFTTDVNPGDRLVLPPNETTAEFEDVLRSYDACVKLVDQMKKFSGPIGPLIC